MEYKDIKKIHVIAKTVDVTDLRINGQYYDDTDECEYEVTNRLQGIVKELGEDRYGIKNYEFRFVVDVKTGEVTDENGNKILFNIEFRNKVVDGFGCSFIDNEGNEDEFVEDMYVPQCFQIDDEGFDDYFEFTLKKSKIVNWKWSEEKYDDIVSRF